jgi:protein ImuB
MQRPVSLFLPTWPTDRPRRKMGGAAPPADTPLILVGREGRPRVVFAANHAAQAAGLHVGMLVTKAKTLVPKLAEHAQRCRKPGWCLPIKAAIPSF